MLIKGGQIHVRLIWLPLQERTLRNFRWKICMKVSLGMFSCGGAFLLGCHGMRKRFLPIGRFGQKHKNYQAFKFSNSLWHFVILRIFIFLIEIKYFFFSHKQMKTCMSVFSIIVKSNLSFSKPPPNDFFWGCTWWWTASVFLSLCLLVYLSFTNRFPLLQLPINQKNICKSTYVSSKAAR